MFVYLPITCKAIIITYLILISMNLDRKDITEREKHEHKYNFNSIVSENYFYFLYSLFIYKYIH